MRAALFSAAVIALGVAATAAAPANPDAWEDVVKAANAEGEVDVHGGPGRLYEQVLTEGFRKAYPRIKLNFSGLSGRDAIPKILNERAAGIYSWDVYVGGTFSVLPTLKPAGAFAPIRAALILPEVTDDKSWYGGLDSGFMDKERRYVLSFEADATPVGMVNWDFVSRNDLKTVPDLLKPEFSNKIVWDDPRNPGPGAALATRFLLNYGADFLKQILTQQKIVFISNLRQNAEWVVRGTYPIGLATANQELEPFWQQGLGKNISGFDPALARPTVAPGFGSVELFDHAPHPNAAKLYVNWLLSKAGQLDWEKAGGNSRRLDIEHPQPQYFPKPGVSYVPEQREDYIAYREEAQAIAREFIGK